MLGDELGECKRDETTARYTESAGQRVGGGGEVVGKRDGCIHIQMLIRRLSIPSVFDEREEEPRKEQDTAISGLNHEPRPVLQLPGADDVARHGHTERSAVSTHTNAEPSTETAAFRGTNHARKIARRAASRVTESVLFVPERCVDSQLEGVL